MENAPGSGDVGLDLGSERLKGGKFLLVAETLLKGDLQFKAVQVAGKIKEMHFKLKVGCGRIDRRAKANIEDRQFAEVVGHRPTGVHTGWGKHKAAGIDVGSWNPELPPALITSKDKASHGVGSSKQGAGGVEIAALNAFTDSGAADRLTVHLDRGKAVNRKAELFAQLFEKSEIPMSPMSESKSGSHAEALDSAEITNQIADELFGGDPTETGVEGDQPGDIQSEVVQSTQALGE
jgi:hypothetical protein